MQGSGLSKWWIVGSLTDNKEEEVWGNTNELVLDMLHFRCPWNI